MISATPGTRSSKSSTTTEMTREGRVEMTDYLMLQDRFRQFAGPGHWNDPDMLIVGNHWPKPKLPGLSVDQVITLHVLL